MNCAIMLEVAWITHAWNVLLVIGESNIVMLAEEKEEEREHERTGCVVATEVSDWGEMYLLLL